MIASGVSVRRSVSPGWPFCPPGFLPERSRRLLTRAGFFSPSLDGGLPLLLLFRPEPALQFGNARLHRRHLSRVARLLRQQQGDEVVLRQLLEGGAIHQLLGIGPPKSCQPKPGSSRAPVPPSHRTTNPNTTSLAPLIQLSRLPGQCTVILTNSSRRRKNLFFHSFQGALTGFLWYLATATAFCGGLLPNSHNATQGLMLPGLGRFGHEPFRRAVAGWVTGSHRPGKARHPTREPMFADISAVMTPRASSRSI